MTDSLPDFEPRVDVNGTVDFITLCWHCQLIRCRLEAPHPAHGLQWSVQGKSGTLITVPYEAGKTPNEIVRRIVDELSKHYERPRIIS